jgi:hypothetical protein
MTRPAFDLQSEFRRMFAPSVPALAIVKSNASNADDVPAPREAVAGSWESIDAHLTAHERRVAMPGYPQLPLRMRLFFAARENGWSRTIAGKWVRG